MNFYRIEKKWQKRWEKENLYKRKDSVKGKKNLYCLDMFPYPSGAGLHVGHLHGYVASDVISRFYTMKGFNVLHPMGFDAFGLPAENAAIKFGIHPKVWTYRNIKNITKQLKSLGASYDWSRMIITSDPIYYKWTQWLFLQLYKAGLAYRAKVPANWCPQCKTILANEQVIDGKCERCDSQVVQKDLEQWLFRITKYADSLLAGLEKLDWPEATKLMQENWIGRSEGWVVYFSVKGMDYKIPVFTTRADTIFGVTYLVLAPEHELLESIKSRVKNIEEVKAYLRKVKQKTERERLKEAKIKTGVELKGVKAINPVNNKEIPIFVADYVLGSYGTGAVMAVPAHDKRDFEFAKKYGLPIIRVIKGEGDIPDEGEGVLVNSGRFSGVFSERAREEIGKYLAKKGLAQKKVYYKLRDWIVSRQRYWGAPIPMINCPKCGWVPVKEKDLPVRLPKIKEFKPSEDGRSPLARVESFVKTKCPQCGGKALRETDTMDTFVDSSWYYLRFADPHNERIFADKKRIKCWLPVDIYIGGSEHSVGHLLYSRFISRFLKDQGYLDFEEPFLKLRHPGIILGPDGQKMSKSRGNVIVPEEVSKKYGMDTLRVYEMFMGPFSDSMPWSTKGIEGSYRFLQRVVKIVSTKTKKTKASNKTLERLVHQTIKKVEEDIEGFRFNTAISALMVLVNAFQKEKFVSESYVKTLLKLLAPFAPHLTEELWQRFSKRSIHKEKWPKYNPSLIVSEKINLIIQVNGKVRDKLEVEAGLDKKDYEKIALESEKVKKWLTGKEPKRIIFVKSSETVSLINIVV